MTIKKLTNQDVPILLIGFNRPEFLLARLRELQKMPIRHLYISIDGNPNSDKSSMLPVFDYVNNAFSKLDNLNIEIQSENLGLAEHLTSAISKVFNTFAHIVVIEDDISMSPNFYQNMLSGFNFQQTKHLRGIIGAFSPLNFSTSRVFNNKWRISKYCSIWGWGCTKSVWANYDLTLKNVDFRKSLEGSQAWQELSKFQQDLWINRFVKIQNNPHHTWDIQFQYASFLNEFRNLYPTSSLVKNVGFMDSRAMHTKNRKPNWMSNNEGDNRLIQNEGFSSFSRIFEKLLDSNTIAGDTKINYWKSKLRL